MLLDPVLRFHCRVFQFLGYQSVSLDSNMRRKQRAEWVIKVWAVLLLTGFSAVTSHTFLSDDVYLYKGDAFGYFNDCLKLGIAHLAVSVSLLETIFRRRDQDAFWQHFCSLQRQRADREAAAAAAPTSRTSAPTFARWRQRLRTHFRFLLMFYGSLATEFCCQCAAWSLLEHKTRHMLLFWCMFTPYILVTRLRNLQCVLHMECMRLELQRLASELRLLAEYTDFGERIKLFGGFEEMVRHKLVQLQLNYERIHEMYCSYQKAFEFSIIAVLLMAYVRVLVDTYFLYYAIYRDMFNVVGIFLIPGLLDIPMFLLTSKNCMHAVKFITLQLHNIRHSVDNELLSVQIQNFSLQLMHQKIRIDALGISVMDGYMLSGAIGSITKHMIFFIEFMPKFQRN